MKTKECEVIQDLLPLYADGSLSKASAELVDEHLSGCEECSKALAHMQSEIKVEAPAANVSSSINDIKKRYFKVFAVILAGILAVAIFSFGAVSIKYAWPVMHGFVPMDADDLTVSEEGGNVVITTRESDYISSLYFLYRVNEDETISMFVSFCSAGSQYASVSKKGEKRIWTWSPFRIDNRGTLEGGNYIEGGSAGGNSQFLFPEKITLSGNIRDIYYVPEISFKQMNEWGNVWQNNCREMINAIRTNPNDRSLYGLIPTTGFDFDSLGEATLIWSRD